MRSPHNLESAGRGMAHLLLVGLAWVGVGGCGSERDTTPATTVPSALLVTFDTTRADALSIFGNDPRVTPNLLELADQSVVFENASAVTAVTLPSHASMLTGLYPPRHTLRDNGLWPLPPGARTLAEIANQMGKQSAAFVAAAVLDEAFGLNQGFDVYVGPANGTQGHGSIYEERPGADVVDDALAWFRERDRERPFFLWVHLFDAHGPHVAPEGFRELTSVTNPYHAEVAYMDAQLGRLIAALDADGSLDETLVVVAGDHGEAFGEKGETSHGAFAYQSTIRVPLLVRDPSGFGAGTRSQATVSVADVFSTIASAWGADPEDVDGESLFRREPAFDRGVYIESYVGYLSYGWSPLAGWVQNGFKYLHSTDPELFDLASDPNENRNLVEGDSEHVRLAQKAIAALFQREFLEREDVSATPDDLMESIRGLGYASLAGTVAAIPHPLAPSDRPSPLSMRGDYDAMLKALGYINTGQPKRAEEGFRALIRPGDQNHFARNLLALALMQQNRFAEALPYLREVIRSGPQWPDTYTNLAVCLAQTGDPAGAEQAFRDALQLAPGKQAAIKGLAIVLRRLGREQEARALEGEGH